MFCFFDYDRTVAKKFFMSLKKNGILRRISCFTVSQPQLSKSAVKAKQKEYFLMLKLHRLSIKIL